MKDVVVIDVHSGSQDGHGPPMNTKNYVDRFSRSIEREKRRLESWYKDEQPIGDVSLRILLTVEDQASEKILSLYEQANQPAEMTLGVVDQTADELAAIRAEAEKPIYLPIIYLPGGIGQGWGMGTGGYYSGFPTDGFSQAGLGMYYSAGLGLPPNNSFDFNTSDYFQDEFVDAIKGEKWLLNKMFKERFPQFLTFLDERSIELAASAWNLSSMFDDATTMFTTNNDRERIINGTQLGVKTALLAGSTALSFLFPPASPLIMGVGNGVGAMFGDNIGEFLANMFLGPDLGEQLNGYGELSKFSNVVDRRGALLSGIADKSLTGESLESAKRELAEIDGWLEENEPTIMQLYKYSDDPNASQEQLHMQKLLRWEAYDDQNLRNIEDSAIAFYERSGTEDKLGDMQEDLASKSKEAGIEKTQLDTVKWYYEQFLNISEETPDNIALNSVDRYQKLKSGAKTYIQSIGGFGEILAYNLTETSENDFQILEAIMEDQQEIARKAIDEANAIRDGIDKEYTSYLQQFRSANILLERELGVNPALLAASYWTDDQSRTGMDIWAKAYNELEESARGLKPEDRFPFDDLIDYLATTMPTSIREGITGEVEGDDFYSKVINRAHEMNQSLWGGGENGSVYGAEYGLPTTGYMLPSMMGYGYPMGLGMMGMGLPTDSESVMELQRSLRDKGYGDLLGGFGVNGDGVDGLLGPYTMNAAMTMFQDSLKSFLFGESTPATLPTGTAPYYGQLGSDPSGKPLSDPAGTYQGGLFDQFSALSSATGTLTDCFSSCSNSFSSFGSSLGSARSAVDSFSSKLYAFRPPSYGGGSGKPGSTGGGSTPAIFRAADGGFLDEPKYLLAGEAGPEAIIPLSQERRARGLDLWLDAGQRMGVSPYADESIIHSGLSPAPSSDSSGGGRAPINVTMNFSIDPATDASSLVASLRENMPAIANDVAEAIASSLEQTYSNMPLSYSR